VKAAALALLAFAAPALAQSAGQWRAPDHIWASSCTYCHDSGVGPHLRGAHPDPKLVVIVARSGLPGMPAFHPSEISDAELAALAAWLQVQPAPAAPPLGKKK
jgi:mono/diheme cytochrome c family protein